jgi:uncharacterized protein CbrC (UPF0167 family)
MSALPPFRFHPDPLTTGSFEPSWDPCRCCGKAAGFLYAGPVYSELDLDLALCPWCIADGSAATRFGATYVDPDSIGNYGTWDPVSDALRREVATRTPGFSGWQQERWWTHCSMPAAFLGPAGFHQLIGDWADAVPAIQRDAELRSDDWPSYFASLHLDEGPTAYVFQCLQCGSLGGYTDSP